MLNFIRKLLLITTIIFSCVFAIAADAKPESAVDTSHFDDKVVVNIGSIAAAENEEI